MYYVNYCHLVGGVAVLVMPPLLGAPNKNMDTLGKCVKAKKVINHNKVSVSSGNV
jgi:hypothetical protein